MEDFIAEVNHLVKFLHKHKLEYLHYFLIGKYLVINVSIVSSIKILIVREALL